MNDIIQLLPDHVANQIAAGEVVQRPASIVKELLENAIDAQATNIKLIVKDAGRSLVQVIDNGKGMSVTDARMAFERHATSKIKSTDDIFHIMTKGFRGEALASIAAVAQVEMKSKRETDDIGTEIQIHGGKVIRQEAVVTPQGTMISVRNLFYNVPARRNFLKSNNVEFRHILDEFHRVALAHENVEFQLIHNGNEVYHLIKTHKAQRILHVFGKKLEGNLVSVNEETEMVKISGFVGKPEVAKKSRGEQFFFVNNRFIKSPYLHKAMQNAFENLISPGSHPSYFIFLEISPEQIDINIHPTKTEVKFEDDAAIYAQLRAACKHALGQHQVTPALDFDLPQWDVPVFDKNKTAQAPTISVDQDYNPFHSSETVPSTPQKSFSSLGFASPKIPTAGGSFHHYQLEKEKENTPLLPEETAVEIDLLQWNSSYLVVTRQNELLMIDQHRAHQTILYDKFIHKTTNNTLSQQLLFPVELAVNEKEKILFESTERHWISYGFDFEIEKNKITINAIPADLTAEMVMPVFTDFLSMDVEETGLKYEENLAKSMAKSAAIKKGTQMTSADALHLVQQLFKLDSYVYSPYGKRNFWAMDIEELIKKLD